MCDEPRASNNHVHGMNKYQEVPNLERAFSMVMMIGALIRGLERRREHALVVRRVARTTLTFPRHRCNLTNTNIMADFFNIKARQAAAAAATSSSSKGPAKQETNRLQPWVEK